LDASTKPIDAKSEAHDTGNFWPLNEVLVMERFFSKVLVMEENTHEIALSGDVNGLVEEIDGLEIVDDDDENSQDDFDGDDLCTYFNKFSVPNFQFLRF